MIKAVIFDMDGVIFNTEALWIEAFYSANKEFNVDISLEEKHTWCGRAEDDSIELLKTTHPEMDGKAYFKYMQNYVYAHSVDGRKIVKDGFIEIYKYIKSLHLPIALATSSPRYQVQKLFDTIDMNIDESFDSIMTDENTLYHKPDPYIFAQSAKNLNTAPENCLVIEDSINGILAGTRANCQVLMVIDQIQPTDEIRKICVSVETELNGAMQYIKNNIN